MILVLVILSLLLFSSAVALRSKLVKSPSIFVVTSLILYHTVMTLDFWLLSWRLTPLFLIVVSITQGVIGIALLIQNKKSPGDILFRKIFGNVRLFHLLFIVPLVVPFFIQAWVGWKVGPRFSDAIEYHLVSPIRWVQEGCLVWDGMGFHSTWHPLHRVLGFPKTAGITAFWGMSITGDLNAGALQQMSWALLGLAAVYAVAREMGLRRRMAIASVYFALLIPEVLLQLSEAYVDLALSSALMGAVLFTYRFWRDGTWSDFILAAVVTGLLGGIKSTGLIFTIVLFLLLIAGLVRHRFPLRRALLWLALLGGAWLVLAGPWYFHNLIEFHNPLYPSKLEIAGVTIFEGPYDKDSFFPMFMSRRTDSYLEAVWITYREDQAGIGLAPMWSGLGSAFFILGLPGLLGALVWAIAGRRWNVLSLIAIFLLLYLFQPVKWHSRYTLYFAWFGGVCYLLCLQRLGRVRIAIGLALLGVCLLYNCVKIAPAAASKFYPADFWHYAVKSGDFSPFTLHANPGEYTVLHYIREELGGRDAKMFYTPNAPPVLLMPRDMSLRLITWDTDDLDAWDKRLKEEKIGYIYVEKPWRMHLWDPLLEKIKSSPDEFELVRYYRSNGLYRGLQYGQSVKEEFLFRVKQDGGS